MSLVACIGDISSHGGVVVTASSTVFASGRPVARMGDLHACPITGHGVTPILSSCTTVDGGRGLVRVGVDMAGCGAVIMTGSPSVSAT